MHAEGERKRTKTGLASVLFPIKRVGFPLVWFELFFLFVIKRTAWFFFFVSPSEVAQARSVRREKERLRGATTGYDVKYFFKV